MSDESIITDEMRRIAAEWRAEPWTDTIERGRIRDWADAIGDPNPLWREVEYARRMGYRDIPAPPTYLYSFTPFYHDQKTPMPRPFLRGFSASDEFVNYKMVQAGDTITMNARIESVTEKMGRPGIGRMLFTRYEYTFTNQDGELVGKGWWTSVNFEG